MATKTTKTKTAVEKTPKARKLNTSISMDAKIFNTKGAEAGTIALPENIFGLPWNADLVHQVVTSMQGNTRGHSTAHTKDRGEVRGGGRKPWQQKGTGRARHGSSRSPIWKGGGITHGPRKDKNYERKVNRQMVQKALLLSLSRKYRDGQIIFVDALEMQEPKTKLAKAMLMALGKAGLENKKKNAALIALPTQHAPTMKSFRNFANINVTELRNINPVSVLGSKYLVIVDPKAAIETLSKKRVVKN